MGRRTPDRPDVASSRCLLFVEMTEWSEVVDFYESSYEESARGDRVSVQIEFERTREIIRRFTGAAALAVADVGGGPGVHARWLADDGHDVTVVDPVPRHVAESGQIESKNGSVRSVLGDARRLEFEDESFDVLLLLGPLYHLQDRADRVGALVEAGRVLKPGGVLFAGAISRFASLHDGFARQKLLEPGFSEVVARDLATGEHENPDQRPGWFTKAYFHRPDDMRDEMGESGFERVEIFGLEGLAGWLPGLEALWSSDAGRQTLLEGLRSVENEPSLLGLSAHLLGVGFKLGQPSAGLA